MPSSEVYSHKVLGHTKGFSIEFAAKDLYSFNQIYDSDHLRQDVGIILLKVVRTQQVDGEEVVCWARPLETKIIKAK